MVQFENATNALVPAQQVVVSDRLTNRLDWTTFELTEIAFGDHFITVPPNTKHFEAVEKMVGTNNFAFEVHIEAGVRLDTGEVYARFQSLNPTNGLPPPVDVGFLPPEPRHNPNDTPPVPGQGRGQGHISYTIRATNGVPTGTEIRNVAYIRFDDQPAIGTDWVDPHDQGAGVDTNKQALVTIDADPPSSSEVVGLPAVATNSAFTVSWTGTDLGSGVAAFDVYVQTNDGPWGLWLQNTPTTSALFRGRNNKDYCFYAVSRDGVGFVQTNNFTLACTHTATNSPPVIDPVTNQFVVVGGQLVITNSAYDPDGVTFSLGTPFPLGATLTTNGVFRWTPQCDQGSTTNTIIIWVTDGGDPPMSNSITFTVTVPECIQAGLGSTNMLAGTTSSIPVHLLSTVALTNMSFTVVYPPERFTNFALTVNSPEVITQELIQLSGDSLQVSFTLSSNTVLHGPTNVGDLSFYAFPDQASAFVPLPLLDITGHKPDSNLVANWFGEPGRVVVVGNDPLLEAFWASNRVPALRLYALPGSTNWLYTATNLSAPVQWQPYQEVLMGTNLLEVIQPIVIPDNSIFFRAIKQ